MSHAPISFFLSWSLSVRSLESVGGGSAKLPIFIFQNFLPDLGPHLMLLSIQHLLSMKGRIWVLFLINYEILIDLKKIYKEK